MQSLPVFHEADLETQEKYRKLPWFSSVTLPLAVVGDPRHRIRAHRGETVELAIFPHTADINQACYDPRLLAGVDYVLTSALVRGRFEADPIRYRAQMRFYALLDSTAESAARIVAAPGQAGPEIKIYRLGLPARTAIAALGPLDPLWWAAFVPDDYRRRADSLASAPGHGPNLALRDSSGAPSAWVTSLRDLFTLRYRALARALALELIEHRRFEPARRLARSLIELQPEDVQGTLTFMACARRLGAWKEARTVLERCIAASGPGAPSPYLTLEYADVLAHDGEVERARSELARALASGDHEVAGEARRRLDDPRGPFRQGNASVRQP